ncbi:MAG: hypothetical protein ACO1RX_04710 [Candidatus Sericytochromatia bacterium]
MLKRKIKQRGYALVTTMGVGVVALTITSAVLLRMGSSTAQIAQREKQDEAQNISELVLNHTLDAIAEITSRTSDALGEDSEPGIYVSARELAAFMHTQDFLNTSDNGKNSIVLTLRSSSTPTAYANGQGHYFNTNHPFWNSLDTQPTHSDTFWNAFQNATPDTALGGTSVVLGDVTLPNENLDVLHTQAYTVYRVQKGKMTADVVLSLVPLATNISGDELPERAADEELHDGDTFANHNDVFKVRVQTFLPSLEQTQRTHKLDVIVNRPVRRNDVAETAFRHAVLAGKNLSLQNFNTSSGPCAAGDGGATCIDNTTNGDVHSNGNLSIGAQGHVQGKATSKGNTNVNGDILPATEFTHGSGDADPRNSTNVTNRVDNAPESRSGSDEIPIPELELDTSAEDTQPCEVPNPQPDVLVLENCVLDDSLDIKNKKSVEYRGKVHIKGDLSVFGSQRCTGSGPCRITVDGVADIKGNGDSTYNSTQESLFVINGEGVESGNCLNVGGNPDAAGAYGSLFYVNNPDCNTRIHGNSDFFGGIITKGSVDTMGNASQYGIQRDSDMSALSIFLKPVPVLKNELFPALISWKDLR